MCKIVHKIFFSISQYLCHYSEPQNKPSINITGKNKTGNIYSEFCTYKKPIQQNIL